MQLKAKAKALVDSTKCQFTASKTSLCIICDLICRECQKPSLQCFLPAQCSISVDTQQSILILLGWPEAHLPVVFFLLEQGISRYKDSMTHQTSLPAFILSLLYSAALPFTYYFLVTVQFIPTLQCTHAYFPPTKFQRRLLTTTSRRMTRPQLSIRMTGCNLHATTAFQAQIDSSTGDTKTFSTSHRLQQVGDSSPSISYVFFFSCYSTSMLHTNAQNQILNIN